MKKSSDDFVALVLFLVKVILKIFTHSKKNRCFGGRRNVAQQGKVIDEPFLQPSLKRFSNLFCFDLIEFLSVISCKMIFT